MTTNYPALYLAAFALFLAPGLASASAQPETETTTASASCTLHNNLYTCDKASFEHVLSAAKTVAIETGPADAFAQDRLKSLVSAMGKTLVPRGEHADLTLLLVPVDPAGVAFNSNAAQLGTLRVFAAEPDKQGRGDLVWAENYSGEPDMEWSQVVQQLVSKYRRDFNLKR